MSEFFNKFFNSGFFNNVGANVLDYMMTEIAEWMLDAKCELLTVTKGMRYNNIEFRNINEIKKYLYFGEDKKIHCVKNTDARSILKLYIYLNTPSMPSIIKFSEDIRIDIHFYSATQDQMNEWKDHLDGVHVGELSIFKCTVHDWDWTSKADVIEFIRLMRVDLPNGFSGFADRGPASQCIDEIKIIKCNIENLNNFPRVNPDAVITIDACPTLHDISGIAEKNNRFDTLNIIQCNHITHTENLSKLSIDTLYAYDDVLDHMIITGDMIGNINKKISMVIKWYSKSNDITDKLNKKYPSADKTILR